jgi:hypothetical protein
MYYSLHLQNKSKSMSEQQTDFHKKEVGANSSHPLSKR